MDHVIEVADVPEIEGIEIAYERVGPALMVRLIGELDISSADVVAAAVVARAGGCDAISVEMSGVSFCDSFGIRCLLTIQAHARQQGQRFEVVRPVPIVRRILEVTGRLADLDVLI
jgi:anti-sigma B factor antagonist/stage II sporulation protein AA (anti-sigma F factor antagonist)